MREQAIRLEEERLREVAQLSDYKSFHERHRIFPAVFEDRRHAKILDLAAGVGCAAARIKQNYPAKLVCNDISPKAVKILNDLGLETVSFDLDDEKTPFPFDNGHFDAVISLATIEHIFHLDHHMQEVRRVLSMDGYLYLSTPNYAALVYVPRFWIRGKTFNDPFVQPDRYEFYAHVRNFTYRTILEFVSSFGFTPEKVYLPLPAESSFYRALRARSKLKAAGYRMLMGAIYRFLSPRWASEPVICFRKSEHPCFIKPRKVLL